MRMRFGRVGRWAGRLALAAWLAVMLAGPMAEPAPAPETVRWPRCYIKGNWQRQLCYCGRVRYPMWMCTRTQR